MVEPVSQLDILTLGKVMVQSGFFPDVKTMAQAVVKIVAGKELGFGPVASLRHIYVHRGHIGLMAQLIASAIRQSGRYDYKLVVCDDQKCEIEFFRVLRDQALDSLGTAAFTIQEATRAGLVKEDSAWKTYPSDVLFARAMTRGQRRYCPDVFRQTVYSKEEIEELMRRDPNGGEEPAAPPALNLMPKKISEAPSAAPVEPVGSGVTGESGVEEPRQPLDGTPDPEVSEQERWEAFLGLVEPDRKTTPAELEPIQPAPAPPVPRLAPRDIVRFTIGKQPFETQGMTEQQMRWSFDLEPQVEKRQKGLTKMILKTFGVAHRYDLTEEQAEQFLIRLAETLGIDPPWVRKGTANGKR